MAHTEVAARIVEFFQSTGLAPGTIEAINGVYSVRMDNRLDLHLVETGERQCTLYGEIGWLSEEPTVSAEQALEMLDANCFVGGEPPLLVAAEASSRRLLLWCRFDVMAYDNLAVSQLLERFAETHDVHSQRLAMLAETPRQRAAHP